MFFQLIFYFQFRVRRLSIRQNHLNFRRFHCLNNLYCNMGLALIVEPLIIFLHKHATQTQIELRKYQGQYLRDIGWLIHLVWKSLD